MGSQTALLDCTIRDGNYTVDFKFTRQDTRVLVGELAALGMKWIEIGHGLGLGASEAGKGDMLDTDVDLITAAKETAGEARVGAFYIPDVGTLDQLDAARDAGMDFVRIGDNATEIERAYPICEYARSIGLVPFVNLMKTYVISPDEFGRKAREAEDAGVEAVYCVDSAGGMLPEEVGAYFASASSASSVRLGFHGHNNLLLVIQNCLSALEHGATYLDVTLCGLGRSAGNAPTEVLAAVLERKGFATGLDLFKLMDVVEAYIWPIATHRHPHDMMSVAAGYSLFHSSFLPKVADVAGKHGVDVRRLAVSAAIHDSENLDGDFLEREARRIEAQRPVPSKPFTEFDAEDLSPRRISNTMDSLDSLLGGMVAASAKRLGARAVLLLAQSEATDAELLIPEFVLETEDMILGRVTFGSESVLRQVLARCQSQISVFLVDQDTCEADVVEMAWKNVGKGRMRPVREQSIKTGYVRAFLENVAYQLGSESLLVYGESDIVEGAVNAEMPFGALFRFGVRDSQQPAGVILSSLDDLKGLNLQFDAILCATSPNETDGRKLAVHLKEEGVLYTLFPFPNVDLTQLIGERLRRIDPNLAYAGILARLETFEFSPHSPVAHEL
ncbi:MAG: hypothetical protein CME26_03140 [Gemmatimonadetes bacterium]|nr:hypothetical protein [Gemmatimonadota bacterium]|tara:strand:- start:15031 stop:16875 length:1845 start_codon:yes stop_codon:yes gene_type:complete